MPRRVEVTYKGKKQTYVEQVYLLDSEDEVFVEAEGEYISVAALNPTAAGVVLFEDGDGMFGLLPEDIINIKEL